MNNKNKIKYIYLLLSSTLIILAHLPTILLGPDSFIIIDDNLDDFLLQKYLLLTTDNLFNLNQDIIIDNVLNGLKISFIHSQFNIYNISFLFFEFLDSYIINSIIIRLIAFVSMFYFSLKFLRVNLIYIALISISWALLPTYTVLGLTILGLPLISIAFYNLSNNKHIVSSYLLIFIYSGYSTIMYSFPFILIFLLLIYVFYLRRRLSHNFIIGISFYVLVSLLLNYNLIETIVADDASNSTHRILRSIREINLPTIFGMIYSFLKQFIFGSGKINSLLISLPIILLSAYSLFKSKKRKSIYWLYSLLFLLIIISVTYQHSKYFLGKLLPIIHSADFSKIINLNSFIFYIILILSIKNLLELKKSNRIIILGILFFQIFLNFNRNPEFVFNKISGVNYDKEFFFNEDRYLKQLIYGEQYNKYENPFYNKLTYKEYISRDLFQNIKMFINKNPNQYKIISFGLDPSVSIYNDLYTLDGYFNNHSLSYHLKFEEIQSQFIKNNYLDNKLILKNKKLNSICLNCIKSYKIESIYNLQINFNLLKNLGANYLLSSVMVDNNNNLKLLKRFSHLDSPYNIFLYELK